MQQPSSALPGITLGYSVVPFLLLAGMPLIARGGRSASRRVPLDMA